MGRTPSDGVSKRRKPSSHNALDVLAGATHQQHQQHQQQRQHQDWDSVSPFDMLDNTGGELASLGFDPPISTSDDIDFSNMDDVHFEIGEDPLNLAFPRLAVAQSSCSSPTASQTNIQPQQQESQPRLQTMQLFDTSSSPTSQSYQDSNSGLSQTANTLSSSTDGVQYWTTQLEELSHTLQKSPIPLDRILRHSSQLLPRISEILQSPNSADMPSSTTSLILILVCLTQVVTLFEQCVPSVLSDRPTASSSDLSLRLGEFQVDRKARQALQIHIVSKELLSMLQVFKLIRQRLAWPEWRDISKRTHNLLLEDLQVQTEILVYQIKLKRGASRMIVS